MQIPVREFESARPLLLSVAYRMLGSSHDAQDAVQSAWVRVATSRSPSKVETPAAWLRTVVASVCLDELRARRRRSEAPLAAALPAEQLTADEALMRKDGIARALMVLLQHLTPSQRVAYVLHDLFAVPFERIAEVLGGTVSAAKKHASRARRRIGAAPPAERVASADHAIVAAFLAAAETGDTRAMILMLAPDSVRDADAALLPPDARTRVVGSVAIATETVHFRDRIRMACPINVDGKRMYLIAPGGHPLATIEVATVGRTITGITLRSARPDHQYTAMSGPPIRNS